MAREIARLTGWKDRIWADRYDATLPGGPDRGLTRGALRPSLAHRRVGRGGDLVRPEDGVQRSLAREGARSAGVYKAEQVVLGQLPYWTHLTPKQYRSRIADLVREIEETAAAARRESLIEPLESMESERRVQRPVQGS